MQQHKLLLWTGRIGGILVTAFFLTFFIGEGLPDILNGMGKELLHFLPFTLLTIACLCSYSFLSPNTIYLIKVP